MSAPTDEISLTFTRHEWRCIAIACMKVNPGSFIQQDDRTRIKELATCIANETGKDK